MSWYSIKETDIDILTRYHDVMVDMDDFYAKYDVNRYIKFCKRGDKMFVYKDGSIEYFITFHWAGLWRRQYKIQCVGFSGTKDYVSMSKLCISKILDFMIENNLTQIYADRPKQMKNTEINLHHDLVQSMSECNVVIEKNESDFVRCRFESKTGVMV